MKRRIVCGIEGQINDAVCFQRRSILGCRGGGVFAEGGENLGGLDKFPLHARSHRGHRRTVIVWHWKKGKKEGGGARHKGISFGVVRANR